MAPKKQQKMSIGDFLADQSLGSWADEMETQPMPARSSGYGEERRGFGSAGGFGDRSGGGDRGFGSARGGFEERPRLNREQLPLPDKPPYTAHLGNLSFEVTEGDVSDFLAGCEVTSIRLVEDKLDRKPKGFGYVEFGTLDGLKKALTLSESQFQGRNIRISVAEPPKDRQDARELNDWTRKGPLPDLPGERRGSDRGGYRGFDPAADSNNGPERRREFRPEGDGKSRDFGNWERKGPLSPVAQEARQGGRGSRDFCAEPERRDSPSWGEGRSDAGSRPPPRREMSERPPPVDRAPTAAEMDTQWRSRMRPDGPSPANTPEATTPISPATNAPPKPAERPRLNLAKRTVSEAPQPQATDAAAASSDSKASPFGAARPIDTTARDREIEEKRQLAIRQRKEADDKAREEKKAAAAAASRDESTSSSAKDSAAPNTPRENGRKQSTTAGKDTSEGGEAAPNKQYEILRRGSGVEGGDAADDAEDVDTPTVNGDKEVKPREIKREVPVGPRKGGNNDSWRRKPSATGAGPKGSNAAPAQSGNGPAAAAGATAGAGATTGGEEAPTGTAGELEDDGFTVVATKGKKGRAGARALAS